MMHRFFISEEMISADQVSLTGEVAHHLANVLRAKTGDMIICVDPSSGEHIVELTKISPETVLGRINKSRSQTRHGPFVALFQGLPKGRKFDEVVEKATEMGADQITPVLMKRSVARPSDAGVRVARWRRVAKSAAEQSQRMSEPGIGELMLWENLLEELSTFDVVLVFWEDATEPIDEALAEFDGDTLAVVIGPEGGLERSEVDVLRGLGAQVVSLGPRLLKTQTAPIAALAIVNYLLQR